MNFVLHGKEPIEFEINDAWWFETDMHNFFPSDNSYQPLGNKPFKIISIEDIKPPTRAPGIGDFKKKKMLPVLKAIRNSISLRPIEVAKIKDPDYTYRVHDGFHRFYVSIAVGYKKIPINILEWL
jgi:hypothetical protein